MADSKFDARDNAQQAVVDLALKNPEFRKELTANPRAALAKIFGGEFPENIKINVHQEDDDTVHIVLPNAGEGFATPDTTYCNKNRGHSWTSCGYELSCYGPVCC